MRKKQRKKSLAAGRDRISELPDEILHSILRCIPSPKQAARTAALSRRWRSLWRSYPDIDFLCDDRCDISEVMTDFCEFGVASIQKFSRDDCLRMESLRIYLQVDDDTVPPPVLEQLVDLSSKRKAQWITIFVEAADSSFQSRLRLPFQGFSDSTVKALKLRGIAFTFDKYLDLDLYPNSLRFLHLHNVEFEHEEILTNLISCSPFLETLEIQATVELRRIRVYNVPKLNTVRILYCNSLEEIEILAPALQSLSLHGIDEVSKIELATPRLTNLEIVHAEEMRMSDLAAVVSKLQSLKYLTLSSLFPPEKKLKLLGPKLETFNLWAPPGLEEIEFDVGPGFGKFLLSYHKSTPDTLRKCEMGKTTSWEVHFNMRSCASGDDTHQWIVGFKSFIATFANRFDTVVKIDGPNHPEVIFKKEEVDQSTHPLPIKHLIIQTADRSFLSNSDPTSLFDGLFWACRPKFLTVRPNYSDLLTQLIRARYSLPLCEDDSGEEFEKRGDWRCQFKGVKLLTQEDLSSVPKTRGQY